MAKYDVYPNPSGEGYLLNIQSDLLTDLNTRIVVPLIESNSAPKPAKRLNPVFRIGQVEVVMVTQFMAAVPIGILKAPIGSLEAEHDRITQAVDMVMQGF